MTWVRIIKVVLIVVLLGLPLTSRSQEGRDFDSGWYAGGGLTSNDVYSYTDTDYCWGCYGSATYGDSDNGYTFTAGYRATRYLAIEASYVDSGCMSWDQSLILLDNPVDLYALDAIIDLTSYQINALGIAAGEIWEFYLRAGIAMWDAQSEQRLTLVSNGDLLTRTLEDSGSELTIGIGVGRTFADSWKVRLDYGYFRIEDDLLALSSAEKAYSDFMSLQLFKRFGNRTEK